MSYVRRSPNIASIRSQVGSQGISENDTRGRPRAQRSTSGAWTPPNGKRKFSFEPTPTKKKKDDVREFTLGQFKERTKKGQYMAVDLSGSEYKIHKADCFLQARGLKLSDGERFYELAWNPGLGQHMAKTKSQMHFNEICAAVIDHYKGALSLPCLTYGSQFTFRIAQI